MVWVRDGLITIRLLLSFALVHRISGSSSFTPSTEARGGLFVDTSTFDLLLPECSRDDHGQRPLVSGDRQENTPGTKGEDRGINK